MEVSLMGLFAPLDEDAADVLFEKAISRFSEINDRFSFDNLFRLLLLLDYDHEDAREAILARCSLSLLVFQERMENQAYKKISLNEKISSDLRSLFETIPSGQFSPGQNQRHGEKYQ